MDYDVRIFFKLYTFGTFYLLQNWCCLICYDDSILFIVTIICETKTFLYEPSQMHLSLLCYVLVTAIVN